MGYQTRILNQRLWINWGCSYFAMSLTILSGVSTTRCYHFATRFCQEKKKVKEIYPHVKDLEQPNKQLLKPSTGYSTMGF